MRNQSAGKKTRHTDRPWAGLGAVQGSAVGSSGLGMAMGSLGPRDTACPCQHLSLKWGKFQTSAVAFRHDVAPKSP